MKPFPFMTMPALPRLPEPVEKLMLDTAEAWLVLMGCPVPLPLMLPMNLMLRAGVNGYLAATRPPA